MGKKPKVSGTIVLYQPGGSVMAHTFSCLKVLDRVFIVDNSESPDPFIQDALKHDRRVLWINPGRNVGVAAALNFAADAAVEEGYDWLLTMDQDSCFYGDNLERLIDSLAFVGQSTAGMVSARYSGKDRYVEHKGERFNELLVAITSGCLLNLKAYKIAGPFMEKLFIDQVDHEYCLRLRRCRFKVLQANTIFMQHQLGTPKQLLGLSISNHPPGRRYYMTRNRIIVPVI